MRAKVLVAALATSLLGAAVQAATLTPETPAAAAQAPGPADPVRLDLARQLMEASGGAKAVQDRVRAMYETADKLIEASATPETARLTERLQAGMREELLSVVPQLVDATEQAYARVLTEKELRDYLAWLQSDSGKAIIAKGPELRAEAVREEMPVLTALMPKLMRQVIDRSCAETSCTAAQRRMLTELMAKAYPGLDTKGG